LEAQKKRQENNEQDDDNPGSTDVDPESLEFGFDREDFEGLKRAIWNSGKEDEEGFMDDKPGTSKETTGEEKDDDEQLDDEDIQKIERMMVKLQTVRDSNAGLPEDQRKRAAAKAVAEVMREL
jgi:hypothetical protein